MMSPIPSLNLSSEVALIKILTPSPLYVLFNLPIVMSIQYLQVPVSNQVDEISFTMNRGGHLIAFLVRHLIVEMYQLSHKE